MDHAMDLALSAVEQGFPKPVIVSRAGSREYVPRPVQDLVDVVDSLPGLTAPDIGSIRKSIEMLVSLIREHIVLRQLGSKYGGRYTLLFQEPRYPWPRLLTGGRSGSTSTLILHNAVEHTGSAASLSSRLQAWIRLRCIRRSSRVATFGAEQARVAKLLTSRPVKSFELPRASRVVNDRSGLGDVSRFPGLLCIGELRPNKGIEIAIEAAGRLNAPLHVVGREVERAYLDGLVELASKYPSVSVTPHFLSAAEFDQAISSADCVLLPYLQFDAQSGVLAKGSAFGVPMIASDLPALREQVRDGDDIAMVEPGSVRSMIEALEEFLQRKVSTSRDVATDLNEWDELVRSCVEGW